MSTPADPNFTSAAETLVPAPLHWTIAEVVRHCNLSDSTIRRRINDGTIPFVQVGGKGKRLLIPVSALSELMRAVSVTERPTAEILATPPIDPATGVRPAAKRGPRPGWRRSDSTQSP